jgi:hypothetical protein
MDYWTIDLSGIFGPDANPPADQLDPNAPTFHATTDCPLDWPKMTVAFLAGALLVYLLKK